MCESFPVVLTSEQRQLFTNLWEKLVLTQINKAVRKKDSLSRDKKITGGTTGWTAPPCCSQFFGENNELFDNFLEVITTFSVTDDFVNRVYGVRLGNTEFEEPDVPKGLLDVLKVNILIRRFGTKTKKKEFQTLSNWALRQFYLKTNQTYPQIEQLLGTGTLDPEIAGYIQFFSKLLLLSLLSEQKVSPHFPRFSALFTCLQLSGEAKSAPCKLTEFDENSIQDFYFVHLWEAAPQSLAAWLQSSRYPLLLEVEQILWQIAFLYYVLASFDLFQLVNVEDISVFVCQRNTGYYRYFTLQNVFMVPNFGNFCVWNPTDAKVSSRSSARAAGVQGAIVQTLDQILDILKVSRRSVSSGGISLATEGEEEVVPLEVDERAKIGLYLQQFRATLESIPTTESTTGFLETFLRTNFQTYQQTSPLPSTANAEDLTLVEDYGFRPNMKIYVPSFIQTQFELKDIKLGDVELKRLLTEDSSGLRKSPYVNFLQSYYPSSSGSDLYGHLRSQLLQFIQPDKISSSITDRYDVDAKQLRARRSLLTYGKSYLALLDKLQNCRREQIDPLLRQVVGFGDVLTRRVSQLKLEDPSIRAAFNELLKGEQPEDFQRYIRLLAYLQATRQVEATAAEVKSTGPVTEEKIEEEKKRVLKSIEDICGLDEKQLELLEGKLTLPSEIRPLLRQLYADLNQLSVRQKVMGTPAESLTQAVARQKQNYQALSSREQEMSIDKQILEVEQLLSNLKQQKASFST